MLSRASLLTFWCATNFGIINITVEITIETMLILFALRDVEIRSQGAEIQLWEMLIDV